MVRARGVEPPPPLELLDKDITICMVDCFIVSLLPILASIRCVGEKHHSNMSILRSCGLVSRGLPDLSIH